MCRKFKGTVVAFAASVLTLSALAQTTPIRVGQLIGTGAVLAAGDLSFSNFTLPSLPVAASPPLDGVGDVGASAVVNADGTVALSFIAIDPATGTALPIVGAALKAIAYDVTVTNPTRLLSTVTQSFGPATTAAFNILTYRPPAPSPFKFTQGVAGAYTTDDTLISDQISDVFVAGGLLNTIRTGSLFERSCPLFFASNVGDPGGCASPLPGGFRASLGLHNFFGVILDRHSFIATPAFPTNVFDAVTMTFTLVDASTPDTLVPVVLNSVDVSQPGIARVSLARTVSADGLSHPGFAPAGGIPLTMTSSNSAALPLPTMLTMPQGASTATFPIDDPTVDVPTLVNATATYNGQTVQQMVTVNPTVPLTLLPLSGTFLQGGGVTAVNLNRVNFSPAVVTMTSSNPAVAPLPATITIAALAQNSGPISVAFQPVAVATGITFTATFNGTSQTRGFVVDKTVDTVSVSKAELTVKSGSLKVEAASNVPTAVLTLSNAATGQLIGTMTNLGKGKYAFQGTAPPVATLRLNSSFSGAATGAVAQK